MAKRALSSDTLSDTDEVEVKRERRAIFNIAESGVRIHRVGKLPVFSMDTLQTDASARLFFVSTLREYGAVEVENVLTTQQCKVARSLFWDYMECLGTGINRADEGTFANQRWPRNYTLGMVDEPETADAGQSALCWYVRGQQNIRTLYSYVYECAENELAGSLDRFGMQRTSHTHENPESKLWLHVDQNPVRRDFNSCYQGVVNLIGTRNGDPGFVCVPHSHQKLDQWSKHMDIPSTKRDFIRLDDEILQKVMPVGSDIMKANASAGSMILFSSALVHCNGSVRHPAVSAVNGLSRLVVYASMQPVTRFLNWATQVLPQRLAMVEAGLTSTHWTEFCKAQGKPVYPRPPKHVKLAKRIYTPPTLNDEQTRWLRGPY